MHEDPENEEHTHGEGVGPAGALTPTGEAKQRQADELGYIEPSQGEMQVMVSLRKAISAVTVEANAIMEGRHKSIALTHLETAQMFFNKAIVNDGIK